VLQTITNDGAIDVDPVMVLIRLAGVALAHRMVLVKVLPWANLVFQATENYVVISGLCKALYGYPDGYYLTGLPTNLNTLFQQAYDAGARVHSNSWGSAVAGDYTANSVQSDTFMWNNRDMVITFSAGNEGIDANSDGFVDADSMGAPATAKNVITVGASENHPLNYPWTPFTYTNCRTKRSE
jgi:hypothetical protein